MTYDVYSQLVIYKNGYRGDNIKWADQHNVNIQQYNFEIRS